MKIELFTQDGCPPCEFLKNYLKEINASYVEYNVSQDESAKRRMMFELDSYSTPTLIIDDEVIRGVQMEQIEAALQKR
ncbi:glutaredoxin domain-containing protein [Bacillus sp. AFS088145]|uniref:glutaredoxin domain-containing protein n=1 Tax=Bacillus sp. AFS088145 TaxID=2033514 RepID=UPI000BFA9114|nr:glutaredoxin domain-containing protein [Bacillus sp. AFS088145]PFH81335.1 NrdH-redoxin [Bacillus sp. AFS088145]